MIKKYIKLNAIPSAVAGIILISFFIGFAVGKNNCEKVPVFVEKEATTTSLSPKTTESGYNTTGRTTTTTTQSVPEYEEVEIIATAYCPCEKCCGKWALNRPTNADGTPIVWTASGKIAKQGETIAVDPTVIPYGTEVVIDGNTYIAEDCGGAIEGYHIDVYFDNHEDACNFGRKELTAYIKKEG